MSSIGRRAFARTLLVAAGLAFTAACSDLPTQKKAAPENTRASLSFNPNAWYKITNVGGKVADVSNAGCCNGQAIHLWSYDGYTNQQWKIEDVGGGFYKITARHSGKAMDVASASQSNGAQVHQWTYQSLYNQQWSINDNGNGTVNIAARHSGKVLTVSGSIYSNGSSIVQNSLINGYQNQQWVIEQI
jgi:hypothetical protein